MNALRLAAYCGVGILLASAPRLVEPQSIGLFATQATSISDAPLALASPDGASIVTGRWITPDDDTASVVLDVRGEIGTGSLAIGPGIGAELLWAPNSQAFFVTTSDEGANGAYRLLALGRWRGSLRTRDLTTLVSRRFGHPMRCGWREVPNVGGIAWIDGSRYLLVGAQIINHSNCDSFGTFVAYEVDPWRMRIVRRYGQLEAKRRFSSQLGSSLRESPDECIRRPRTCYVAYNHPQTAAH